MAEQVPELELNLQTDPRQLVIACTAVRQFAQIHGIDEKSLRQLELAVDEVCSNIICHAYNGDRKSHYRIRCYIKENDLVVEVMDSGKGYSSEENGKIKPEPCLRDRANGGLGVQLIKKMTDHVEYVKLPTGENCCRFSKTLPAHNAAS
jgi:serine/threonine-protein kinase RsbW